MTIHNYEECPRFSDCLRGRDGTCKGCNLYNAYLAGLGKGKPKWHDLRKNPDDLPKEDCTEVMFITKGEMETLTGKYKNGGGEGTPIFDTFGIAFYGVDQVIAWCDLPKFKE